LTENPGAEPVAGDYGLAHLQVFTNICREKRVARVGIEPTTPRFSASSAVFGRLRLPRFSLLIRGFKHFADSRFSAVFGRRVDLVLT
jgi:hypothetical protein